MRFPKSKSKTSYFLSRQVKVLTGTGRKDSSRDQDRDDSNKLENFKETKTFRQRTSGEQSNKKAGEQVHVMRMIAGRRDTR